MSGLWVLVLGTVAVLCLWQFLDELWAFLSGKPTWFDDWKEKE